MDFKELADGLAGDVGAAKYAAAGALKGVMARISDALAAGESVSIPGFGKFSVIQRAARTGVNPRTRQKMAIPARKAVKFSAARALKDAVG